MIKLDITVEDIDSILLHYDVVRVYRATSETGSYSVIDTVTLVAGTTDYAYLDATGISTYYYKTSYYNTSSEQESSLTDAIRGGATQIPTIASTNIEENIRERIDDTDATDYEFEDAAISRAVDRAVTDYSGLAPYEFETTITTVADEDTYALPDDCVRVLECDYRSTTINEYDELDDYYPYMFGDWNHPALTLIKQKLQQAYDDIGRGYWVQVNSLSSYRSGQYLIIYPEPDDSGDTFTVRYTIHHEKVSDNYATIPSHHVRYIEDLAVAGLLERLARKMDNLPTQYRSGQTTVSRRGTGNRLDAKATELRQGVADALSEVVIARG